MAGNVLKEIVEPAGAVIFTEEFQLGDPSVSALELWGAGQCSAVGHQYWQALLTGAQHRVGTAKAVCRKVVTFLLFLDSCFSALVPSAFIFFSEEDKLLV